MPTNEHDSSREEQSKSKPTLTRRDAIKRMAAFGTSLAVLPAVLPAKPESEQSVPTSYYYTNGGYQYYSYSGYYSNRSYDWHRYTSYSSYSSYRR